MELTLNDIQEYLGQTFDFIYFNDIILLNTTIEKV